MGQVQSFFGLMMLAAIAWGFSEQRKKFPWRIVAGAMLLQLVLALLLLKVPQSQDFFQLLKEVVSSM